MHLNAFRFRVAMLLAGVLTMAIYVAMGGHIGPSHRGAILIEYGMDPRTFEGCDVVIDGSVAGKLKPFGSGTRTGFEVMAGDHQVRVIHPGLVSRPRIVHVQAGAVVPLTLDYIERHGAKRGSKAWIGFPG